MSPLGSGLHETVDFHKLFWQPISCAAFLLKDARQFRFLEMHSDYLNPESHERQGVPDLVSHSLATTRRFDALKLWISLQTLGREKLGAVIDRTLELAQYAAQMILALGVLACFISRNSDACFFAICRKSKK